MKKAFMVFALIFLSSCATPDIRLKGMNLSMEMTHSAPMMYSAVFSPDDHYILTGSVDKNVRLWSFAQGRELKIFKGHTNYISSVEFSPDGKRAVSSSWDKTIKIWDIETGKEIRTLIGHAKVGGNPTYIAVSPDGRHIASCSWWETIRVWDSSSGRELWAAPCRNGNPRISFSRDGRHILSAADHKAALRDPLTGKVVKYFPESDGDGGITSIVMSPDGRYIAVGTTTGAISLWDVQTEQKTATLQKLENGGITALAFSPDGKTLLSGAWDASLKTWDVPNGQFLKDLSGHSGGLFTEGIKSIAFSSNGKFAITTGDASVRLWNVTTGEEIAMMISYENGEWITITNEGYYNASENGAQYLSVTADTDTYSVDRFYDVFYRPDIVAAKLRGEDISGLMTITMIDAIKNPPPVVEFSSKLTDIDQPRVKVCYQVKSTGGGIGEVRLFHNGKLIQSDGYYRDMARSTSEKQQIIAMNSKAIYENMRSVSVKGKTENSPIATKSKGEIFNDCREIEAVSGENEVSVTAFNGGNTVQGAMRTAKFKSAIKPEDPHLYILSVGIDRYKDNKVNLKYAAKDATDIEQKLLKQSTTVYKSQNIHYELLIDSNASKGSIINKINELSRIIKPNDGFILFVAGHGVLLQNQYYMLTSDYDGMVSDASMISSNEIVEMSKKIKSLSQLFIFDTCHAGGVDTIVSGLYDARMSVLAKKMGLHIYASANSIQEAQDGYQGNGLFTYTLLDGLNNKKEADKNRDNAVSLVELGGYAKQTTTEISKTIGHSQTPLIINFGKDNPVYNLK